MLGVGPPTRTESRVRERRVRTLVAETARERSPRSSVRPPGGAAERWPPCSRRTRSRSPLSSQTSLRSIGVGAGTGNNAVIRKALQRLEHFGLARPIEGGYAVRTWGRTAYRTPAGPSQGPSSQWASLLLRHPPGHGHGALARQHRRPAVCRAIPVLREHEGRGHDRGTGVSADRRVDGEPPARVTGHALSCGSAAPLRRLSGICGPLRRRPRQR